MRTPARVTFFTFALLVGLAAGCAESTTAPTATFSGRFDDLWANFDRQYSYFTLKAVDWDAARARFRERAATAASEDAFIAVIREMLGELRDVHVKLISPGGQETPTYAPTAQVNWERETWLQSLNGSGWLQYRTNLGYGRMRGIPYIAIGGWNDSHFGLSDLDAVLEPFRNASSLIVDVRPNGGGNDQLALAFAGRFATRPVVTEYFRYRNGPAHSDFGTEVARSLTPRGPWTFSGPVIVLSGRGVFSSNESFIAAMRELPNVTVIGDTTGGGSGNPATYDLGGGWKYTVSRWFAMTSDHQPIEGRGIAPHTYVPWDPAVLMQGRDPVLEAAMRMLGAPSP
jgi:hypothetical protein